MGGVDGPTEEMAPDSGSVFDRFVEQFLRDEEAGQRRSLDEYLRMFRGDAESIAAEYLALSGVASRESRPQSIGDYGPYRILERIQGGGQGIVYLAQDRRLGSRVALKVMRPPPGGLSHKMRERFVREAKIVSRLDHPGICTVLQAGLRADEPWIAMRYIPGEPLSAKIRATKADTAVDAPTHVVFESDVTPEATAPSAESGGSGPSTWLELSELMKLFERAARALHYAHECGVIHRDIKPGNIMVKPDGKPVILDFGLARPEDDDLQTITDPGEFFGTVPYMSPEQLAHNQINVDARSDIYSLGVSLYECLAGRRPFEGHSRAALLQAIMTKTPPDVRALNPGVTKDLKTVVDLAMAKDRDHRIGTAEEFANLLECIRRRLPLPVAPPGPLIRFKRWCQRSPALAAAMIGLFLALAAGLTVSLGLYAALQRANAGLESTNLDLESTNLDLARKQEYYDHLLRGHAAFLDGRWFDLERHLSECRDEYRNWEWRYLRYGWEASKKVEGSWKLMAHDGPVTGVSFVPGSDSVVTSGSDGSLKVWNSNDTRVPPRVFGEHKAPVTTFEVAPDGSVVVSGDRSGVVMVWSVKSGTKLFESRKQQHGISSIGIERTGKFAVTFAGDHSAQVIDLGKRKTVLGPFSHQQFSDRSIVAAHPTLPLIATWGGSPDVQFWDVSIVVDLETFKKRIGAATVGKIMGKILMALQTSRVESQTLDDLHGLLEIARPPCPFPIRELEFTPDGSHLIGAGDGGRLLVWTVPQNLWNVSPGEARSIGRTMRPREIASLEQPRCVALNDGGLLATAQAANIRLTDQETLRTHTTFRGHGRPIADLAFDSTGTRLVSGDDAGEVIVWDLSRRFEAGTMLGPGDLDNIVSVALAPDGNRAAMLTHLGELAISDVGAKEPKRRQIGPAHQRVVRFSEGGRVVVSADSHSRLRFFDVQTFERIEEVSLPTHSGKAMATRPDADLIAVSKYLGAEEGWQVVLLSDRGQKPVGEIPVPEPSVLCLNPGGEILAAGTRDGEVLLFEVPSGQPLETSFERVAGGIGGLAFSEDGRLIAAGGIGGVVSVWSLGSGERIGVATSQSAVADLKFIGNDRLVTTERSRIVIWEVPKDGGRLRRIVRLDGDSFGLNSLAVSKSGTVLGGGWGRRPVLWHGPRD